MTDDETGIEKHLPRFPQALCPTQTTTRTEPHSMSREQMDSEERLIEGQTCDARALPTLVDMTVLRREVRRHGEHSWMAQFLCHPNGRHRAAEKGIVK